MASTSANSFSCDYDAPQYYTDLSNLDSAEADDYSDAWFDTRLREEGDVLDDLPEEEEEEEEEEEAEAEEEVQHDHEDGEEIEGEVEAPEEEEQGTPPGKRTHQMTLRQSTVEKTKSSDGKRHMMGTPGRPQLTIPETPDFVRRGRERRLGSHDVKSSEQLEMEQISQLQQARRKAMQVSKNSFRSLQTTNGMAVAQLPKRTAHPPTIPVEFKFQVDNRLNKNAKNRIEQSPCQNPSKFPENLRQYSGKGPVKAARLAPTQPKPFNLTSSHRPPTAGSKNKENAQSFLSAAEQFHKFHTATPDRFRTRSRAERERGPVGKSKHHSPPRMTIPHTPNLRTRSRTRPANVESEADLKEKEIEEMKAYQFKATKFDPRIVSENGGLGLPKRAVPKTTVPLNVKLATEKRCDRPKTGEPAQKRKFKAQPIPGEMFDRVLGVPERPVSDCTDARTPNIRRSKRKAEDILEAQAKRQVMEHAQPPAWSPPKSTVVVPFNLQTEVRGHYNQKNWQAKVEAEEEEACQKRKFRARSANVCYEAPFKPAPSGKTPVVPDDFVLNSERRAEDRQKYEAKKAERELQIAEEQHQRKLEMEKRNKDEIEQLRRSMVHKAQPVRHYKPVEIQRSNTELTHPVSPEFSERITAKYHRAHDHS